MTGHDEHTQDQDAVQPPWIMDDIPEDEIEQPNDKAESGPRDAPNVSREDANYKGPGEQGHEPVQHDPDLLFLACPACADGWMSGYIGGEWVCSTCGHKEERT